MTDNTKISLTYLGDSINVWSSNDGMICIQKEYSDGSNKVICMDRLVLQGLVDWLVDNGWNDVIVGLV